jgi:hypothetical protein
VRRKKGHATSRRASSNKFTLDELADELNTLSSLISTQVRTLNLGVLGVTWLLLLKSKDLKHIANAVPPRGLLAVAVGCLLALVLDFTQYLLAHRLVSSTYDKAEADPTKTADYDPGDIFYRAQKCAYYAKMVFTFGAAITLVSIVGAAIV